MAGVVAPLIPLALPVVGEIINLIASLVHKKAPIAEKMHGDGTGPVKHADVFTSTKNDLIAAHNAGQIPVLPDDNTINVVIKAVVASMKLSGTLDATTTIDTTESASAQSIVLTSGQSMLIKVA